MKITPILKLDKNSKKSPIFIRLRDRFDGKDFQSTINVGFSIEPKYFKDGSVQLIFTSPPYYSLREYNQEKGLGNEDSVEEYIEPLYSF